MTRKRYETPNGLLHVAKELGIDDASFHQLPGWRAEGLLDPMLDTFTKQGSQNRRTMDLERPPRSFHVPTEIESLRPQARLTL